MLTFARVHGVFGGILASIALAACSSTTYGTGVTPGMQTVQDLTGMGAGSKQEEAIAYQPRPALVTPPANATLPPPGGGNAALAANWPADPDELAAQVKADAAAREAAGMDPNFTLPQQRADPYAGLSEKEREQVAIQLAKQARSGITVDENGNPVRRYLSDPPGDYMVGDPTVPVEVPPEDKKTLRWKWPWQWFSGSG
jgi:hypothetical protein